MKIAAIFNTCNIGGAERSFLAQLKLLKNENEIGYFIPKLVKESPLIKILPESAQVFDFFVPKNIYQISRTKNINLLLTLFSFFIKIPYLIYKNRELFSYDIIYTNGNKVALLSFFYVGIFMPRKKFIWHFRDYPSSKYLNFLYRFMKIKRTNLSLVANSFSVKESIKKEFKIKNDEEITVIYNPTGNFVQTKKRSSDFIIGIPAMLAPWKGLHQIPIFSNLFERELIMLGVKEIRIYGANIYLTKGDHFHFAHQLNSLLQKFPNKLVRLCDFEEPAKIYSSIDVLLHTSIEPKPFGRVIVEAFKAEVPVISTALGGSSELVEHGKTGIKFNTFDYKSLLNGVKKVIEDKAFTREIVKNAKEKVIEIEQNIETNLEKIICQ